jgi:hypothetical protein
MPQFSSLLLSSTTQPPRSLGPHGHESRLLTPLLDLLTQLLNLAQIVAPSHPLSPARCPFLLRRRQKGGALTVGRQELVRVGTRHEEALRRGARLPQQPERSPTPEDGHIAPNRHRHRESHHITSSLASSRIRIHKLARRRGGPRGDPAGTGY